MGFLMGFISQDEPKDAYIHLLCLEPTLRGYGLVTDMLKEFSTTVSDLGCTRISLITKPHNKKAIKFYNNVGFKS